MLSYMRKNASSWIIKVLFAIIVIVFVFFYGFSDVRKGKESAIASVGDRKINMAEYRSAYKNMLQLYQNIYKNQFTDEMIEKLGLKQKVLEELIDREVLLQEAERLNLQVNPEEVRKAILASQTFHENGVFSQRLYQRVLKYYGISAADYERDMEKELMIKTIENMIKNSVKVSEKEIKDVFNLQREKVIIEYVKFDPEDIKEKLNVSEDETSAYYEEHKEDFRVPAKVKVKYLLFDPQAFESKVSVLESEIKEYYEMDPEQFYETKKVKVRHILLKLGKEASVEKEQEIRAKADNILEQLNKGSSFEKLAEKHSEDTASARKGGDLGFFKKGDMVKPFEEAAFKLKPGETSSPVRTKYGFHIIRVEEVKEERTKPFEEVKESIEKDLRREKAQEFVTKEAKRAFNRLFKKRNVEEYAKKKGFELIETDYFIYGKSPEDLPGKELFSEESFLLSPGEIAPSFAIGNKYFLIKLADRKEAHIPAMKEVTDKIVKEVEKQQRLQMAKDRANKILTQVMESKEKWGGLGKKYDLKIEEIEFKRQGEYIAGIGNSKELKEAVFALKKTETYVTTVFQTENGIFIVRLKEKQISEDFDEEKDGILKTVIQNKQQEMFENYLQTLKSKSEIRVDNNLFSSV